MKLAKSTEPKGNRNTATLINRTFLVFVIMMTIALTGCRREEEKKNLVQPSSQKAKETETNEVVPVVSVPEGYGSIVHNGIEMGIESVVAYRSLAKPNNLYFEFLPYEVDSEDVTAYLSGDRISLVDRDRSSPDAAKWEHWVPYGSVTLIWNSDGEGFGNFSQCFVQIYLNGITKEGSQVTVRSRRGEYAGQITGSLTVGEPIELITSGEDTVLDDTVSWNLRLHSLLMTKAL